MEKAQTIGRLAGELGLPVSTLRYYERAGLVRPTGRSEGNYRLYGAGAGDRIRFIRMAQATGFTLADIRQLLELRDGDTAPCGEVRALVEKRLADTTSRIEEFKQVQAILESFLEKCEGAEAEDECHVMEELEPSDGPVDDLKPIRRRPTGR
ncbi:MAG: heavy metal-responsive transcriptional regulator [Candidatus Krumholzibacteriia bacterium]